LFFVVIEKLSVSRDEKTSPRLTAIDAQLQSLQRQQQELRTKWDQERAGVTRLQELKNQIDAATTAIAKAEREFDYNAAAILKYGTLPELQQKLKEEERLYDSAQLAALAAGNGAEGGAGGGAAGAGKMLRDTVTDDDIALIVSSWTGIPITKLQESEMKKLLKLQEELDKRVVGQRRATQVVAEAIQRSRAGMSDPSKPIATLAFLGPTGVGKSLCVFLYKLVRSVSISMPRLTNAPVPLRGCMELFVCISLLLTFFAFIIQLCRENGAVQGPGKLHV
jgi:ATP-dependent Clp protease ATP-binding subunit ClpB